MPISKYLAELRAKVGNDLIVVPSVTALIFDEAGKLLLLRHANKNLWVAPGGAVDPDESPTDAVVREVWEESGLHVEPIRICGAFGGPEFRVRYANGDEAAYVMTVFECRRLGGDLRPDGVETLEARWVARSELDALDLAPWARKVLPALLDSRGRTLIERPTWTPPQKKR